MIPREHNRFCTRCKRALVGVINCYQVFSITIIHEIATDSKKHQDNKINIKSGFAEMCSLFLFGSSYRFSASLASISKRLL